MTPPETGIVRGFIANDFDGCVGVRLHSGEAPQVPIETDVVLLHGPGLEPVAWALCLNERIEDITNNSAKVERYRSAIENGEYAVGWRVVPLIALPKAAP